MIDFNASTLSEVNYEYCRASTGLRFVNYLIDSVFTYILIFVLGFTVGIFKPELLSVLDNDISGRLFGLVFYAVIMAFTEAMLSGKSIGKLITKTKAINLDGSEITFGKSFSRNLIRAIPFNALSALGTPCNPWHDKWSDTIVVEEKKVNLYVQKATLFETVKNQTL